MRLDLPDGIPQELPRRPEAKSVSLDPGPVERPRNNLTSAQRTIVVRKYRRPGARGRVNPNSLAIPVTVLEFTILPLIAGLPGVICRYKASAFDCGRKNGECWLRPDASGSLPLATG